MTKSSHSRLSHKTRITSKKLFKHANGIIKHVSFLPMHVIVQFMMQYCTPSWLGKPYVICDIDGTISDVTHRLHFITPSATIGVPKELETAAVDVVGGRFKKDFISFYNESRRDPVKFKIVAQLREYYKQGYQIVLLTARPEAYRQSTMEWLAKNIFEYVKIKTLIMRKTADMRQDVIVKEELYNKYFKHCLVEAVFEDRPRVIRMWRQRGLKVIDAGDGIEF